MKDRAKSGFEDAVALRRELAGQEGIVLGNIGVRLLPGGEFNLPLHGTRAKSWRKLCRSQFQKLKEDLRIVAMILLAADIRPDLEALLKLPWQPKIKERQRNLNTILGCLVKLPSSRIGNGFRVLKQQRDTFRTVLLGGDGAKLPWLDSDRHLRRKPPVIALDDPIEEPLKKHFERVSVVIINSYAADEELITYPETGRGLDYSAIGNALRFGGYVVLVLSLEETKEQDWWLDMTCHDLDSAGDRPAVFAEAGEAFLIYWSQDDDLDLPLRGRRVALLQKVIEEQKDKIKPINELFADLSRIKKRLPSSEPRAFAQLLEKLGRGRGCVFSPTAKPEFLRVLREAAQIANWRLMCAASTHAKLEL
jgi:hypothetical protein